MTPFSTNGSARISIITWVIILILHIWQKCVSFGDFLPMRTLCDAYHKELESPKRQWNKQTKILRKYFRAPTSHSGENSWSQIPGWVDGVTAVEPKRGANDEHNQTNHDRCHPLVGGIVVLVYDGEDTADKESRAEQLKTESNAHEKLNSSYIVKTHC